MATALPHQLHPGIEPQSLNFSDRALYSRDALQDQGAAIHKPLGKVSLQQEVWQVRNLLRAGKITSGDGQRPQAVLSLCSPISQGI